MKPMLRRIVVVVLVAVLLASSSAEAFQKGKDGGGDGTPTSASLFNCGGNDLPTCIQAQFPVDASSVPTMGLFSFPLSVTWPTGNQADAGHDVLNPWQIAEPGNRFSGVGIASTEIFVAAGANTGFLPEQQPTISRVPEPATMSLIGLGLIGLAVAGLRKRLRR